MRAWRRSWVPGEEQTLCPGELGTRKDQTKLIEIETPWPRNLITIRTSLSFRVQTQYNPPPITNVVAQPNSDKPALIETCLWRTIVMMMVMYGGRNKTQRFWPRPSDFTAQKQKMKQAKRGASCATGGRAPHYNPITIPIQPQSSPPPHNCRLPFW